VTPKTVLLLKTSSLGDILHTLPALTDAQHQIPGIRFHWVVEENFAEIPAWHPTVSRVLPIAWRRWRKNPINALSSKEPARFYRLLRENPYSAVLDIQGLLKSALPASLAHGPVWGLDFSSAREPLASLFYQHRLAISPTLHAITRNRLHFAQALNYTLPNTPADYGLGNLYSKWRESQSEPKKAYFVFLHSTTWASKHWPEPYWKELCKLATATMDVILPWGDDQERERAVRMAKTAPERCHVADKMSISQLAALLANAQGVVSVDTGPAHLAAAVGTPTICLYGPTDPAKIGTVADNHQHLTGECHQAPCKKRCCPLPDPTPVQPACFQTIPPEKVWQELCRISHI
jgi:heptosyltransferase I